MKFSILALLGIVSTLLLPSLSTATVNGCFPPVLPNLPANTYVLEVCSSEIVYTAPSSPNGIKVQRNPNPEFPNPVTVSVTYLSEGEPYFSLKFENSAAIWAGLLSRTNFTDSSLVSFVSPDGQGQLDCTWLNGTKSDWFHRPTDAPRYQCETWPDCNFNVLCIGQAPSSFIETDEDWSYSYSYSSSYSYDSFSFSYPHSYPPVTDVIPNKFQLWLNVGVDSCPSQCYSPEPEQKCQVVQTANIENPASYAGVWYVQEQMEIAYYPNLFFYCIQDVITNIPPGDNLFGFTISVENTANDISRNITLNLDLCSAVPDLSDFSKAITGDCKSPQEMAGPTWIVEYNEEAGYAFVIGGQPYLLTNATAGLCSTGRGFTDSGMWILTRQRKRNETVVDLLKSNALTQGIDTQFMEFVNQTECDTQPPVICKNVTTVTPFDSSKYFSGEWFVQEQNPVVYLPEEFFYCVKAEYTVLPEAENGYTINVRNTATNADRTAFLDSDKPFPLCGFAPDWSVPSKAAVGICKFGTASSGAYWIVDYNEEEGYALVSGGQPFKVTQPGFGLCSTGFGLNDSGLFILTRAREFNSDIVTRMRSKAFQLGIDTQFLKFVDQEECDWNY